MVNLNFLTQKIPWNVHFRSDHPNFDFFSSILKKSIQKSKKPKKIFLKKIQKIKNFKQIFQILTLKFIFHCHITRLTCRASEIKNNFIKKFLITSSVLKRLKKSQMMIENLFEKLICWRKKDYRREKKLKIQRWKSSFSNRWFWDIFEEKFRNEFFWSLWKYLLGLFDECFSSF